MNIAQWKLGHWVSAAVVTIALMVLVIGGITFYDAWQAELLPWQPDPTRVVVRPFADLPQISTPAPTPPGS